MEDHHHHQTHTTTLSPTSTTTTSPTIISQSCLERNNDQPVRSRWTPKPEQILILETIFNSGMVNPPKEETVKIRKLLEKFGSVGDANVFYWFQNRRSRSRRRQRQIQASLMTTGSLQQQQQSSIQTRCVVGGGGGGGAIDHYQHAATPAGGFVMQQPAGFFPTTLQSLPPLPSSSSSSSSCSRVGGAEEMYSSVSAVSFPEIDHNTATFQHLETSKVHYELGSGVIIVFINGVPTEVKRGPLNIKSMFGEDLIVVHSSGVPVPLDEYGVSMPGLQHGESYYLVSRSI